MARIMEVSTPLGNDVLLFRGLHAREELSRVGEYQLELLSAKGDIDIDTVLGTNLTVKLALADDKIRHFNGFVTRFSQTGLDGRYFRYHATLRPWLWFLSRTADCRIFQEQTVPDILAAVFGDHSTAEFAFELTQEYRKWPYCVQYRETDLNFVCRLMEHEGLCFYLRHTDGHHTLVVTDSYAGHAAWPGLETVPFISPDRLVGRPDLEHISRWEFGREIQPGIFAHADFDPLRPGVKLGTQKAMGREFPQSDYEVFDYPGHYTVKADGEQYAAVRIDELSSQFELAAASTNARALSTGYLFKLSGHARSEQNREYLVVSASHDLAYADYEGLPDRSAPSYRCSFSAMSTAQQFRPRRATPKPFVQGPQTAIVVGPKGDEIHTDAHGRVKVQFHWDRKGAGDENSSCWIRVSHPWAGKGWGSVSTPRIGQEVIVDFLEGDPDQPIITGRVYNGDSRPPFGFPAGAVRSGIKSNTHKGRGYNELSMDDTAGKEKITIHGQFDMNTTVEHDQATTVHNNRTDSIGADDSESVGNNQSVKIGANQTLSVGTNQTTSVGSDQSTSVGKNQSTSVDVNRSVSVGADQSTDIGGQRTESVGKSESISVGDSRTDQVAKNEEISIGKNRQATVGENDTIKVGKKFGITAGDQITIQTGSASIVMKKDGTITIKGKDITIDGSGKINIKASSDVVIKGSKITQN